MKLPTAPEVCTDCEEGRHILHIIHELADLYVTKTTVGPDRAHKRSRVLLVICGYAEDEEMLDDLIKGTHLAIKAYNRTPEEPNNALLVPVEEDDECPNCHNGTLEKLEKRDHDVYVCRGECGAFFRGPRKGYDPVGGGGGHGRSDLPHGQGGGDE